MVSTSSRSWSVARVSAVVLLVTGFLTLVPVDGARAQTTIPISVAPSSGLRDLQQVAVASVSPGQWPAGLGLSVLQCAELSVAGCDNTTTVSVQTDGAGSFSAQFTVHQVINPAVGRRDCGEAQCYVVVSDSSISRVGRASITFGGDAPTAPPETTFEPGPGNQGPGGETLGPSAGAVTPACPAESWRVVFSRQENGNEHLWVSGREIQPDEVVDPENLAQYNARRLTTGSGRDTAPAVSPDGTDIAFVSDRRGSEEIWLLELDTGGKKMLTNESLGTGNPAWSPDGATIVFDRSIRKNERELWAINKDGTNLRQLTNTKSDASFAPSFSPDGASIAFTSWVAESKRSNHDEIFLMSTAATGTISVPDPAVTQLTSTTENGDFNRAPAWSPDGSRVVFHGKRGANIDIFSLNVAVPQQLYQLTSADAKQAFPVYSPDGTQIVYQNEVDGDGDLWVMAADGSAARAISTLPAPLNTPPYSTDKAAAKKAVQQAPRATLESYAKAMGLKFSSGTSTADLADLIWRSIDPFDSHPDWSACIGTVELQPPTTTPTTPTTVPPTKKAEFGLCVPTLMVGIWEFEAKGSVGNPASCLKQRLSDDVYQTTDRFKLNGLEFTPSAGSMVKIDPKARRVWSEGKVFLVLGGTTVPIGFPIDKWTLSENQSEWSAPPMSVSGVKLFGLDFKGSLNARMTKGESALTADVALPAPLPSGALTLATDNALGLHVNDAKLKFPSVNIVNVVSINDLVLSYKQADNTFETRVNKVGFLGQSIDNVYVRIANGSLADLSGTYVAPAPGLLVGAGVFLTQGTFKYVALPITHFAVQDAKLTLGPSWKGFPAVMSITGGVDISSEDLVVTGKASVVDRDIGTAKLIYKYNKWAELTANVRVGLGDSYAQLDGNILYQAPDNWGVEAGARVHVNWLLARWGEVRWWGVLITPAGESRLEFDADGRVIVSSKGMAVCGSLNGWLQGGVSAAWNGGVEFFGQGCGNGKFTEKRITISRFQSNGQQGTKVSVAAGVPYQIFRMGWQGELPRIVLSGPGGRTIKGLPDPHAYTIDDAVAIINAEVERATYIVVRQPEPGSWTIGTEQGSPPIAEVATAQGLSEPEVTATVTGRGATRRLAYTVAAVDGQKVRFVERGPDTSATLGTVKGARGSLRFSPGIGSAGDRTIVAEVFQDGTLRRTIDVATYIAPAVPVLSAPKGVHATRAKKSVEVMWKRVKGADHYLVVATLPDGRRFEASTKRPKAVFTQINRKNRVVIIVTAAEKVGALGAPTKVVVKRAR